MIGLFEIVPASLRERILARVRHANSPAETSVDLCELLDTVDSLEKEGRLVYAPTRDGNWEAR